MEAESAAHSRLLALPAELRLRIWEYALAPTGTLFLTSTKNQRFATRPVIAPAVLRTCRQIHNEAASMIIAENSICITIDAHDTCWPTIAEARLPQRALEKLEHMFMILDCTATFRATYDDVDWTQLSALTSLKTLRLTILARIRGPGISMLLPELASEYGRNFLPYVLSRIPAGTAVAYGTEAGTAERSFVDHCIEVGRQTVPQEVIMGRRIDNRVVELDGAIVEAAIAELADEELKQGCLSGGIGDVWGEYRDGFQR